MYSNWTLNLLQICIFSHTLYRNKMSRDRFVIIIKVLHVDKWVNKNITDRGVWRYDKKCETWSLIPHIKKFQKIFMQTMFGFRASGARIVLPN